MQTAQLIALASIEKLINEALKYDPASYQQLRALDDHVFHVQIQQPDLDVWLQIDRQQVFLLNNWPGEVNASLSGKLTSFMQVAGHPDKTRALMEHSIRVSGESQSLSRFQNLLGQINIDWEAALADKLGDLPGHLAADGLRMAGQLFRQVSTNLGRSSKNFLREESGWFAHPLAFEDFSQNLTEVRFQVDRLEARINKLKQQLDSES